MNKLNSYTLTGIILSIVGSICLILTIIFGKDYYRIYKYGEKTNCIVKLVRLNESSTIVEFKVNGMIIEKDLGIYDSSIKVGDKMAIYYDKKNVKNAFVKSQILLWLMLVSISLIIIFMGVYFFTLNFIKRKQNRWLIKNGKHVKANIIGVEGKKYLRIFKRHPSHIRVEYVENGTTYLFNSEDTFIDLTSIIKNNNIHEIDIYIDNGNYNKYYIELENIFNKSK